MPNRRLQGMPWKQVRVSEQRMRFAIEASKPGSCMAALCREYRVSRQTGYLWLKRYRQGGAAAVLTEQSRKPHISPHQAKRDPRESLKDPAIQHLRFTLVQSPFCTHAAN